MIDNGPSPEWPSELARRLGEAIGTARRAKGMSAAKLSEATARLGAGVHRVAIPRIEKGTQSISVTELIALGVALDEDWSRWLVSAVSSELQRRNALIIAAHSSLTDAIRHLNMASTHGDELDRLWIGGIMRQLSEAREPLSEHIDDAAAVPE